MGRGRIRAQSIGRVFDVMCSLRTRDLSACTWNLLGGSHSAFVNTLGDSALRVHDLAASKWTQFRLQRKHYASVIQV
jgi:hypothetical protein